MDRTREAQRDGDEPEPLESPRRGGRWGTVIMLLLRIRLVKVSATRPDPGSTAPYSLDRKQSSSLFDRTTSFP